MRPSLCAYVTPQLRFFRHADWGRFAWAALAVAGTLPAAYAMRALDGKTARLMLTCLVVTLLIDLAISLLLHAARRV